MADFLSMSDDEFAKEMPPVVEATSETAAPEGAVVEPEVIEPVSQEQVEGAAETSVEEPVVESSEGKPDEEIGDKPPVVETAPETKPKGETPPAVPPGSELSAEASKTEVAPVTEKVIDYKAAYENLLTPFKANGKMIQVNDLAEAKQLMQMGANFTKKMQELQPHRKMLMMLDNNGLMDEGKLSFLIDLDRKNPEAIKKLIKESGINPMEIDTESDSAYQAGNHRVTDEAVSFKTILDDLGSNPEGKETLQVINREWDQASKEALWKEPGVMPIIHEQRANGIYSIVSAEVDRLRTLGAIPPDVPFIQAYKVIGENLGKAGKLNHIVDGNGQSNESGSVANTPTAPVPLAQRVVAPKPAVSNSAQAQAASQQRNGPRKVEAFINPLAMDDDAFLEQMKNRL